MITHVSMWMSLAVLTAISLPAKGANLDIDYRIWVYEQDCGEFNSTGERLSRAKWEVGLKFFDVDVYAELERLHFKHVRRLIRLESLAVVDEQAKAQAWMKANRSKYPSGDKLISAARAALSGESFGVFIDGKGVISLKDLCECYNRERREAVSSKEEFVSKTASLEAIRIHSKAKCIQRLYKGG